MALSGQTVVTTPGTAVQLGSQVIDAPLLVKALDTNTGVVALGNDGSNDVSLTSGMRLLDGECIVFTFVGNLADIWLVSAVSGEGVSWLVLNA